MSPRFPVSPFQRPHHHPHFTCIQPSVVSGTASSRFQDHRVLCGNASSVFIPLQDLCVSVNNVHGYGLHQLEVVSKNLPIRFCMLWYMEQSTTLSTRVNNVAEHVQTEARNSSFPTAMNTIRCRCGVSVILALSTDVHTELLIFCLPEQETMNTP